MYDSVNTVMYADFNVVIVKMLSCVSMTIPLGWHASYAGKYETTDESFCMRGRCG
jgi:hypothetical protein